MDRIAIFASGTDEARAYARDHNLDDRDVLYVRDVHTLHRGHKINSVVVLPGFPEHRQASELAAAAFSR